MSVLYGSDAIGGVLYIAPEKYLSENGLKVNIEVCIMQIIQESIHLLV